jgi:dephospho-CoA kinase
MLTIGLTGGIASGKSVVSNILRELGAYVIDADTLVHEGMSARGDLPHAVSERFGKEILNPDGSVNRDRLAKIVFSDADARHDLEAIVHPWVRRTAHARFEHDAGGAPVGILDAALLVEAGDWEDFDRLLVVYCDDKTQLQRLMDRDHLGREASRARIAAQLPTRRKLDLADHIVNTEGTLEDTRKRTEHLWQTLVEEAKKLYKKRDPHRIKW